MEEKKREYLNILQLDTILCFTEMQAAIGNVQIKKLDKILKKKNF